MTCLVGRLWEITHQNGCTVQGKSQRRSPSSFPGTPFIFKGKQLWIGAIKRMPKIKRASLPTLSYLFSVRIPALAGASFQPLSQHISHLFFYSCWVIFIVSCSEMFDKNLVEWHEENLLFNKGTCHCVPGTSKLSQYLIFIISSPPLPALPMYEQCVLHCSVGKIYF